MNDLDFNHDFDLDWVAAEQPPAPGPDAATTAHARRTLLAYATSDPAPRTTRAAGTPRARRRRAPRLIAAAAVAVAAAGAAATVLPSGERTDLRPRATLAPPAVKAAPPLVLLAQRLQTAPAPAGDATLVLRKHTFPHDPSFTGADLYLDDGRYLYGATLKDLRQGAAQDPGEDVDGGAMKREVRAAIAAPTLSPDAARARMVAATGVPTSAATPGPQPTSPALKKQLAIKQAHKGTWANEPPMTQRQLDDNLIWTTSIDVLAAGAGRADVRAGVLSLLATMPSVIVTPLTEDGRAELRLRCTEFPRHYEETLTIDANTGVLLHFEGGTAGNAPDVTVTYDVKRVVAKDVLAG